MLKSLVAAGAEKEHVTVIIDGDNKAVERVALSFEGVNVVNNKHGRTASDQSAIASHYKFVFSYMWSTWADARHILVFEVCGGVGAGIPLDHLECGVG